MKPEIVYTHGRRVYRTRDSECESEREGEWQKRVIGFTKAWFSFFYILIFHPTTKFRLYFSFWHRLPQFTSLWTYFPSPPPFPRTRSSKADTPHPRTSLSPKAVQRNTSGYTSVLRSEQRHVMCVIRHRRFTPSFRVRREFEIKPIIKTVIYCER